MMRRCLLMLASWPAVALADAPAAAPVDSYRFLHVTIDTPWHIFLFLLVGVFAPFILMVVLVWRNSWRRWTQGDSAPPAGEALTPGPSPAPSPATNLPQPSPPAPLPQSGRGEPDGESA